MRPVPIPPNDMTEITATPGEDPIVELYDRHYAALVRLVSGLLDDNESCEEVVQEAFASLIRAGRLPEPDRRAAYLRSTALNGARSRLRKRRVRRRHLHAVPDPVDPAETTAVNRLEHQQLLEAIRSLPARQADVLLLRYQADLSEAEIAATLGISPGSVKTHASRGLATVRRQLEEMR